MRLEIIVKICETIETKLRKNNSHSNINDELTKISKGGKRKKYYKTEKNNMRLPKERK